MSYNPGVFDVVKGAYLTPGAVDRTMPTTASLNRGDLVIEAAGKWILADTQVGATVASKLYAVLTPTDRVSAFAGDAFAREGAGNVSGLGLVNLRDGSTVDPIGTGRSGGSVVAGDFMVTAYPLDVPGEFRISVPSTLNVVKGDKVDVGVDGGVFNLDNATGRFLVTSGTTSEGIETVYANNKTMKSLDGQIVRQGGPATTITFIKVA